MIMQGVPHLGTLAFPHGLSLRSPIRGGAGRRRSGTQAVGGGWGRFGGERGDRAGVINPNELTFLNKLICLVSAGSIAIMPT